MENKSRPLSRDEMSDEVFDKRMSVGLSQAKAGEGEPPDLVFERLRLYAEIQKGIDQAERGETMDFDTALARIKEKRIKAK